MERLGPAPDGDMFLDADSSNAEPVTVEYEHALSGPQTVQLQAGQRLSINPVVSRRWVMTAPIIGSSVAKCSGFTSKIVPTLSKCLLSARYTLNPRRRAGAAAHGGSYETLVGHSAYSARYSGVEA